MGSAQMIRVHPPRWISLALQNRSSFSHSGPVFVRPWVCALALHCAPRVMLGDLCVYQVEKTCTALDAKRLLADFIGRPEAWWDSDLRESSKGV